VGHAVQAERRLSDDAAFVDLLAALEARSYRFITPTPSTRSLVAGRRDTARAGNLRDIFGWSLPFQETDLDAQLLGLLRRADAVRRAPQGLHATVRVSTVEERPHLHSAPGAGSDAVFLGPDSYRFVRFLKAELRERPEFSRALDLGTGAGVGALALKALNPSAEVFGSDPNGQALRLARANGKHAGLEVGWLEGAGLEPAPEGLDLIIANPPYIADAGGPTYRDGGDRLGAALSLEWARDALRRLDAGGRFVLYTGAAVVDGEDLVLSGLEEIAGQAGATLSYEEIDPDVFGSSLRRSVYREAERIAAVGAVLTRQPSGF